MNARHRHDYRDYEYNRYPRPFHDGSSTPKYIRSYICDLDNDVHPIFRPTNFPGARYEVLKPALQIASRLLNTDCLLDFWHAVFFGEKRWVQRDDGSETWHISYRRRRVELSAKDRAETRLKLQTLSHMFKFYRDGSIGTSSGVCFPSGGISLASATETGLFDHGIDKILYHEVDYEHLCKLFDKATDDYLGIDEQDLEDLRLTYFQFAITLVHEVAHAAVIAQHGDEHFLVLEESTVSEDGYDWENHIFGGLLSMNATQDDPVEISTWPCPSVINSYLHDGTPIWVRGKCADVTTRFSVPKTFITQMFTTHFWEVIVPATGHLALKAPRIEGYRNKVDDSGSCVLFQPEADQADRFDGIPEEWYEDGGKLYILDPSDEIDAEGLGRLMRVNCEGIWADDKRFEYDSNFPALPKNRVV